MRSIRFIGKLAQALVLVAVGALALRALFAPDPLDVRRRADALLASGQYYTALRALRAADAPDADASIVLRLGVLHALRGEPRAAEDQLRRAIRRGLRGHERDTAYLYLGVQHAVQGRRHYAENAWAQVVRSSPLYGPRLVLEAERALTAEDYAPAEAGLQAALAQPLPEEWRRLVIYRLALLLAARDPAAAAAVLKTPPDAYPISAALLRPLLPVAGRDARSATQLAAVLQTATPERNQLLGQIYLDARLYRLADAQFALVPAESARARAAAAYAAYNRWQAGDRDGGMARLQALVARYPDDVRARSLLAVAYLQLQRPDDAATQLDALGGQPSGDPATYLAWGQWFISQGDYPEAAAQFRSAIARAPDAERASYARAAAQFHLTSGYAVCDEGRSVARDATAIDAASAGAWEMLAAISYHCRDAAAARDAARRALELDAGSAMASYYLGVALALLGDPAEARIALTRAADLAPASIWRQRAETELHSL